MSRARPFPFPPEATTKYPIWPAVSCFTWKRSKTGKTDWRSAERKLDAALTDLTEKSNILNTTMQSMEQGIIMVDRDMRVLTLNDNLARLFSLEPEIVAGVKTFQDLQEKLFKVSALEDNYFKRSLEIARSMKSRTFEHSLFGRGVSWKYSNRPWPTADLSAPTRISPNDAGQRSVFQTMAANLPGAIFQAQILPEGRLKFIYVSPGSSEHFDLSPEDLVSGAQRIEIHPEDRERFLESLKNSL